MDTAACPGVFYHPGVLRALELLDPRSFGAGLSIFELPAVHFEIIRGRQREKGSIWHYMGVFLTEFGTF